MVEYLDKKELKEIVNENLEIAYNEANKYIPEDLGDLKKDLNLDKAKVIWNSIKWSIFIDETWRSSEYSEFIHSWVPSWASRNYYKNWWRRKWLSPFLTSTTWTQFINRWADKVEDNL